MGVASLSPATPPALRGGPASQWSLLDVRITEWASRMRRGQHPASPLASAAQHVQDAGRGSQRRPMGQGKEQVPGRPRGADPGLTTPSHGEILQHEARRCQVVSTPTPEDTDLCVCPDESVRQSVMSDSLQPHGM